MQNITTPETAQLLKDAGFPQPQPTVGQYWCKIPGHWDFYGLISRPHKSEGDFWAVFLPVGPLVPYPDHEAQIQSSLFDEEYLVYAPTATDIMKVLGQQYVLWYDDSPKMQVWVCAKTADLPNETQKPFAHINPANAAAKAFLDKKQVVKMENKKQLPDWDTAPKWAMYRAVDQNGHLNYYDAKPFLSEREWWPDGDFCEKSVVVDSTNWRESLEQRPSA